MHHSTTNKIVVVKDDQKSKKIYLGFIHNVLVLQHILNSSHFIFKILKPGLCRDFLKVKLPDKRLEYN